ncbi:MAG: GAF domain-containing sensor histidine kinase [Anaerolineae bacterium]|nr:GAF domain-containing sensor histidine kinase [Anaerolineae bacterium]
MSLRTRAKALTSRKEFWILAVVLVVTALLHYVHPYPRFLGPFSLTRHAVGRILLIIPVVLATFFFGRTGGLITLVLIAVTMLPRVLILSEYPADALVETIATSLTSYLVVGMHQSRHRMLSRLRTLNAVAAVLTESLELEQILHNVLDTLIEVLHVEAGAVYLVNKAEQGLTLVAHRNLPAEFVEESHGLRSARMLKRHKGLRCHLAVPLQSKGQINGLLIIGNSRPCPSLQREVQLVTTISQQISVAVENARLYEDIARQLEIELSVREVVEEITSELELNKILPRVIQIAEELVGADGGVIALWDDERNLISYPYVHNLPWMLADVTVPWGDGVAGEVMATGQSSVIEDYQAYPKAVPAFVEAGVTSVAAVPIVSSDRVFGALCVISLKAPKSFLDRDVAILAELGRHAGIAVENAYLYGNLRFYARRMTQAQESERKRIARELHDDTIQSLIALSRRLEALATPEEQLPEAIVLRIKDLWGQTDATIQRVRRFSQNLRPSIVDDLGLLPALEELTADLNQQTGIKASFQTKGTKRRLSSEVELTLFRVAQEALSNVRRHAEATEVLTSVELTDTSLRMTVRDNGKGFRPRTLTEDLTLEDRLGVIGMHERVRLLGGTLVIDSAPGRGTAVIVRVLL